MPALDSGWIAAVPSLLSALIIAITAIAAFLQLRHYRNANEIIVGIMLRFLEHISVLVTKGGIAEKLVLAEYADTFAAMWESLRPAILQRRKAFGPHTGRAFEHLAMLARDYDGLLRDPRPL